ERSFLPTVFLLDDGFQHARLKRDLDIVLLDGIDPLAGDAVFPLGRLRESMSALDRADVIVITRAGKRRFDGLLRRLPNRPVFFADVDIAAWHPARPSLNAVAAFSGLANPLTFSETLKEAGARVLLSETFRDHHRFTTQELRDLADKALRVGASALVTTEKDFVNLPADAREIVAPLSLHHLEIRLTMRNETDFLRYIRVDRKLVIRR
ncbi:MAG TPA: tetraacyldisaccharide 4'-kinase, partial [Bryobacteraceae bacterium]|nr:tetraacyldisaccharide 4'-kinase [Bryobacteraceae bacterium]